MFLSARAAAATLPARAGGTRTTSTRSGSMRVTSQPQNPLSCALNGLAPGRPMTLLRPLPRRLTRAASVVVLLAWTASMGLLVRRSLEASTLALGADLSKYGASAQWKGVYSRGEKIGYLVGQTTPRDDGYELAEDGQLMMTLLGASTAARLHTSAVVDRQFQLRSFAFKLDPGTGPITVAGRVEGTTLHLTVKTPSGERTETRALAEPPSL